MKRLKMRLLLQIRSVVMSTARLYVLSIYRAVSTTQLIVDAYALVM
jgi:hypothetical protein